MPPDDSVSTAFTPPISAHSWKSALVPVKATCDHQMLHYCIVDTLWLSWLTFSSHWTRQSCLYLFCHHCWSILGVKVPWPARGAHALINGLFSKVLNSCHRDWTDILGNRNHPPSKHLNLSLNRAVHESKRTFVSFLHLAEFRFKTFTIGQLAINHLILIFCHSPSLHLVSCPNPYSHMKRGLLISCIKHSRRIHTSLRIICNVTQC